MAGERATPGYYACHLAEADIEAELAVTRAAALTDEAQAVRLEAERLAAQVEQERGEAGSVVEAARVEAERIVAEARAGGEELALQRAALASER